MIYLASPYSGTPEKMQERFEATELFLSQEIARRYAAERYFPGALDLSIVSPIIHMHSLAEKYKLPTTTDFWWEYNKGLLDVAGSLLVLKLSNWDQSKGVQREIGYATGLGLEINYAEQ